MKLSEAIETLTAQFSELVAHGLYGEMDGVESAKMLRECEALLKRLAPDVYRRVATSVKAKHRAEVGE
jgi:hypothetical protein